MAGLASRPFAASVIGSWSDSLSKHCALKAKNSLLGESALQAFRADQPLGGANPDVEDEATILAATLLRQQLSVPAGDPSAVRIRSTAVALAAESLGQAALDEGCTYDEHPSRSDVDVIRRLSQRTEHKGWLHLAQHLLETLGEMAVEPVDQGRLLDDRARNSRKQGFHDLAQAQLEELGRLGKRVRSNELIARTHLGLAAVAQVRGNMVGLREHTEMQLKVASRGKFRRLVASAHVGLGTYAGRTGDYSNSVAHLWQAYRAGSELGVIAENALGTLAQVLMLAGRPGEGRKVSSMILATSKRPQALLPRLGTYALCSAALNEEDAVAWSCARVRELAKRRHYHREIADALVECAIALEMIGRPSQAGVMRRRAETLANTYGFFDLTFTEALSAPHGPPLERPRFFGGGAEAEREIAGLSVPRIPEMELAGV